MATWMLTVTILCSQPRLDYRVFYTTVNHTPPGPHWMAFPMEETVTVQYRLANTLADYADYTETYRDKCSGKGIQ